MDETTNKNLSWSALEYEERDRTKDWFWALGIIIATSSITAIIFGDYFFAVLIILSGVLIYFFATKKPETIYYELNGNGLVIKNLLYPYEDIKSFWIQIDTTGEGKVKPMLFVHSHRVFMPIIIIPILDEDAEIIYGIMTEKNIPEVEMHEHPGDKIMEALGF